MVSRDNWMFYPPIKHMIIGTTYVIVQLISITTPAITTCLMSILRKRLLFLALLNYFTKALMDLGKSNSFYTFITTLYRKWIRLESLMHFSKGFCKFISYLWAKGVIVCPSLNSSYMELTVNEDILVDVDTRSLWHTN